MSERRLPRIQRKNVLGCLSHETYTYKHDFAVLCCDLRIIYSALVVNMRHIEFHFLSPVCKFFRVTPCLQEYDMI